jgi:hypothetical protein
MPWDIIGLAFVALDIYIIGAIMGYWTFLGTPVSFRP